MPEMWSRPGGLQRGASALPFGDLAQIPAYWKIRENILTIKSRRFKRVKPRRICRNQKYTILRSGIKFTINLYQVRTVLMEGTCG